MAKQLQLRKGTTADHSTFIGAVGELSVNTQTGSLLLHDGTTPGGFAVAMASSVATALALKEDASNKGIANGYASLDASGLIPVSQLPAVATNGVTSVTTSTPLQHIGTTDVNISIPAASAAGHGYMTSTYANKLDGIEAGATADQTKADIDALGINAATLDGFDSTYFEQAFTKNTAFNKNFGTTTGTVAQGDDSRINNGQTAFGWGNHAVAGYAAASHTHTGVYEPIDVNITRQGNTFNGISQLVQTDGTGKLPALDGSNLINVSTVASIEDLTDVNTMAPADGQVLTWDSLNSRWDAADVAGGSGITFNKADFTATAGQTVFTVTYSPSSVAVFVEGTKLRPSEYTATNGTSITLNTGVDEGTWVQVLTSDEVVSHNHDSSYALTNHSHSGAYEPIDATILRSANIGVSVQGYNINTVVDSAYVHTDNNYTTTDKNKLAGIEAGATADQTPAEILTALLGVDGTGSGLDADKVDGLEASAFMQTATDGSYYGLKDPTGSTANWIRTTTNGIIPSVSGGSGSIGTSSWPFTNMYTSNMYIGGVAIKAKGTATNYGGAKFSLSGTTLTITTT